MSRTAIPAFVIAYSDSEFTNPHEMVLSAEPADCRGNYTHMGAQYWGLETSRHRATTVNASTQTLAYNHDAFNWITIGLKERHLVDEITVSTKWFTGNQVQAFSATLFDELTGNENQCIARTPLKPDADHTFKIDPQNATECRLKLHYEGGMSRVNLFGTPSTEQLPVQENLLKAATISHVSNEHYGNPRMAVDGERGELHMRGWESARTGFGERALFALRAPTIVDEIIVDTYLHRLNPPLSCHIFGLSLAEGASIDVLMTEAPCWQLQFEDGKIVKPDDFQAYMLAQRYLEESAENPRQFSIALNNPDDGPWQPIAPFIPLERDTWHRVRKIELREAITHLLYMHYPNGGIHGLKLFGQEVAPVQ